VKITKLHLVLLAGIAVVVGLYVYQIRLEQKRLAEIAERAAVAREAERKRAEEERERAEEALAALAVQKKDLAVQAVAVAGEYWKIAKKAGRDVSVGQETLRQAKEKLRQEDFEAARAMARDSIDEFKAAGPARTVKPARPSKRYYTVRSGDSLWKIAKMPRHYGRGALWPVIWRANQDKIPDFDLIYPRQVLFIPKTAAKQERTSSR
jgi:Uncharacterized protein containing LysM domain